MAFFWRINYAGSCAILLAIAILVLGLKTARCESDASDSTDLSSSKRQFLIAPRVGRSGTSQAAYIWPSGEPSEISFGHHTGNPARSAIIYFAAKRRLIGPRSGGLIPQARIGRRAAPLSGLLPQPRVGRRSTSSEDQTPAAGTLDESGQQEVAVATLSDSTSLDALESLLAGR